MSEPTVPNTIIIGLSGPSSSGKTTLARLLRGVFNIDPSPETNGVGVNLLILHEDDFYKTDTEIPIVHITHPQSDQPPRSVQDWDCVESLNLPLLDRTIRHVRQHGRLPASLVSKEDQNSVGEVGVSEEEVGKLQESVKGWLKARFSDDGRTTSTTTNSITIFILDGFLLFPPPPTHPSQSQSASDSNTLLLLSLHQTMASTLNLKLFLPSTKSKTLARRAARSGYVTMEGFWEDPPGYVEDVVWPNYARDHAWMFKSAEDVDSGRVDVEAAAGEGVVVGPGPEGVLMREVLEWGVGVVKVKIGEMVVL